MEKLRLIAREMREYALAHVRTSSVGEIAPYRRELGRGLRLVLYLDVMRTWHLSLYRPDVFPSPHEIQTVRRDFSVPEDAKMSRQEVGGWFIVRLEWREAEQVKLFEVAPVERSYYEQ